MPAFRPPPAGSRPSVHRSARIARSRRLLEGEQRRDLAISPGGRETGAEEARGCHAARRHAGLPSAARQQPAFSPPLRQDRQILAPARRALARFRAISPERERNRSGRARDSQSAAPPACRPSVRSAGSRPSAVARRQPAQSTARQDRQILALAREGGEIWRSRRSGETGRKGEGTASPPLRRHAGLPSAARRQPALRPPPATDRCDPAPAAILWKTWYKQDGWALARPRGVLIPAWQPHPETDLNTRDEKGAN